TLRLSPAARGAGIRFEDRIKGGAIPREFIPGVEAGIARAAQAGVLAGYPCVDFTVTLLDGSYHERDSSVIAFEVAAAAAFREAFAQAGAVLLEPVMDVEVGTPASYVGDVIGDLSRRRGTIRAQHSRGSQVAISAYVPLREMFSYIGTLRALSSGRAQYTMQFDHYAAAPSTVTQVLTAA
ncbi:MAG TPA: elongation factor G, partial [Povalibacter sp.]|nr:elongation factor G [Povalibacter sp.]